MKKISLIAVCFILFFLINTSNVFAIEEGKGCSIAAQAGTVTTSKCDQNLICKSKGESNKDAGTCVTSGIQVERPSQGFTSLGNAVSNILTVAFAIAALAVLIMLILGAFEWIFSGGDKDAVGKARGRIINAIIGLAVLAVAFALARVAAQFTGMDLFNITIPTPNPDALGF